MNALIIELIALKCSVEIPERVRSLTARAADGYVQVLCDHAPLLMAVLPGMIEIDVGNGREPRRYRTERGGYLQALGNHVSLVLRDIEPAGEADMKDFARAIESLKQGWDAHSTAGKRESRVEQK